MTPLAAILIAASAALHATWHTFTKKSGASLAFIASLATVGMIWSFPLRFFVPLRFFAQPLSFHLWLAGVIAAELVYVRGLSLSYRALDMSVAYPMMRALPLLMLAAFTTAFGFGKPLGVRAFAGMAVVFAGCLLVPLKNFSDFMPSQFFERGFGWILLVALGTTGYTFCDSQAQRAMDDAAEAAGIAISKPALSLAYYSFRAVELCLAQWAVVLCGRQSRAEAAAMLRGGLRMPLAAGVCASLTYALVLVAMNYVSNVAYVQAFRQIGLLVGLAEGVFILHERCPAPKIAGTVLILAGLALLVL